jgi:hypothetical protein
LFLEVVLARFCDPLGDVGFYRGQVDMVAAAATTQIAFQQQPRSPTSTPPQPPPQLTPLSRRPPVHQTSPLPPFSLQSPSPLGGPTAVQLPSGLGVWLGVSGRRAGGRFARGLRHGHGVQRHPGGRVAYAGEFAVRKA